MRERERDGGGVKILSPEKCTTDRGRVFTNSAKNGGYKNQGIHK